VCGYDRCAIRRHEVDPLMRMPLPWPPERVDERGRSGDGASLDDAVDVHTLAQDVQDGHLAANLGGELVDERVGSIELCFQPVDHRVELRRSVGLPFGQRLQVRTFTPELILGDLLLDREVGVVLGDAPEELEPVGELGERGRRQEQVHRSRRSGGERSDRTPSEPILDAPEPELQTGDPDLRFGHLHAGRVERDGCRMPGCGRPVELCPDVGELLLRAIELLLRVGQCGRERLRSPPIGQGRDPNRFPRAVVDTSFGSSAALRPRDRLGTRPPRATNEVRASATARLTTFTMPPKKRVVRSIAPA
jgi:hypothetical protein